MHASDVQERQGKPAGTGAFLRVKHVAALLDAHPATVYRAIASGDLEAHRIGHGRGGLRISRSALEAFIANSVVRPGPAPVAS